MNSPAGNNLSARLGALRIYVDMDGVICDIVAGYQAVWDENPDIAYPQSLPGLFEGLAPLEGAVPAVNRLRRDRRLDVWVLSAPSVRNPHSYTEKRLWIEKHFDYEFAKRLILCDDKSLLIGDVLIDDHADGKGQERFEGRLIQFGSERFPNWVAVEAEILRLSETS